MDACITAPGCYELTDEEYHADPVVGGSLSSTGARELLRPGGPAKFHWNREHGRPDKPHFDLGRAAHSVALGVGQPIASLPFTDRRTKAYKVAEQEARDRDEIPLLEEDAERVYAMATALHAHEVIGPLLARPGRAEQSYVGRDPESGVMCRVRIDWLPDAPAGERQLGIDLKTAVDASPEGVAKSMADYGYHQQGPFYGDVLNWNGLTPNGWHFLLVVIEKDPPYLIGYGSPDAEAIEWGEIRNRAARDLYRGCSATDTWPGHSLQPAEYALPTWTARRYEDDLAAGRYDTAADRAAHLIGDAA